MSIYADSPFPVAAEIDAVHEEQISSLGQPGTWFTGAQRLAIVSVARAARVKAGLAESDSEVLAPVGVSLPDSVLRIAERVAVEPQTLTREFYDQALADGLTDAEYVEVVALVARLVDFDVFARGLGVPLRVLPEAKGGIPERKRPEQAADQGAWTPTVPGGPKAEYIYGNTEPQAGIISSASLVPAEARAQIALEQAQYLPLSKFMQWDYQHHAGLTRPQVELVAGRISDFHDCFY